jgi:hypothetical protein
MYFPADFTKSSANKMNPEPTKRQLTRRIENSQKRADAFRDRDPVESAKWQKMADDAREKLEGMIAVGRNRKTALISNVPAAQVHNRCRHSKYQPRTRIPRWAKRS